MARILIGNVRNPMADNLTTAAAGKFALDANQGRLLDAAKLNKSDVVNTLTTAEAGKALDARQGRLLDEGKLNKSDVANDLSVAVPGKALDACRGKQINEILDRHEKSLTALHSDVMYIQANGLDGGQTFGNDFLMVDVSSRGSGWHQNSFFGVEPNDVGWVNVPSDVNRKDSWIGIRYVLWRNPKHIMVEIHEMYPLPGRLWFNFYNYGKWSGWKKSAFDNTEVLHQK